MLAGIDSTGLEESGVLAAGTSGETGMEVEPEVEPGDADAFAGPEEPDPPPPPQAARTMAKEAGRTIGSRREGVCLFFIIGGMAP
jgi:hypothetical protein